MSPPKRRGQAWPGRWWAAPGVVEVSGGIPLDQRPAYAARRGRPLLGRPPSPIRWRSGPWARPVPPATRGLRVARPSDVGNTETDSSLPIRRGWGVAALQRPPGGFASAPRNHADAGSHPPLAAPLRSRPHPRRAAGHPDPGSDLEGWLAATGEREWPSVPLRAGLTAELRQMAQPGFADVPCILLGPGVKSGAFPLRQPKGGGCGPGRQTRRRVRPLRRPSIGGPRTATTFEHQRVVRVHSGVRSPGVAISLEALFHTCGRLRGWSWPPA